MYYNIAIENYGGYVMKCKMNYNNKSYACCIGYIVQAIVNNFVPLLFLTFHSTYDISIEPYEDCCTVFVPRHPVINPSLKHIYNEEGKYDFEPLINEAVNSIEVVDLEEKISDLL